MCRNSLRHITEVCIPRVEHYDPQFTCESSSGGQVGNENGYRYTLLRRLLRDCWLICDKIYSLNLTVKGGARIITW